MAQSKLAISRLIFVRRFLLDVPDIGVPCYCNALSSLGRAIEIRIEYRRRTIGSLTGIGKGNLMTTTDDRTFLKVQLLETERLQQSIADHPLMSRALSVRQQELGDQIQPLLTGENASGARFSVTDERVTDALVKDASNVENDRFV